MMWESSIYRFVIPRDETVWKEVLIDVTASVPPFVSPRKTLGSVLDQVSERLSKQHPASILDFGSGKLRNTLYLLRMGLRVCSVEFEKVQTSTPQAKSMYSAASNFGDLFWTLVFPHEFINSTARFDLILLVNVCNIMPVHSERLLVLQYCRRKLEDDGFVLWYTQHRDQKVLAKCQPDVRIGDGYYMNKERRYQTFYRDFEPHEIDSMFLASGFRLEEKYRAYGNQARLYRKVGNNPLQKVLSATKIRRHVVGDRKIPRREQPGVRSLEKLGRLKENVPDPDELRVEQIYLEALMKLPAGRTHQTEYHNLMAAILIRLFVPPLAAPVVERDLDDGQKRIDVVLRNPGQQGFFGTLSNAHGISAPYILVECKNYHTELRNPEIDQLSGRFKPKVGEFGIITYRNVKNEKKLLKRCRARISRNQYILCLNDEDTAHMLRLSLAGQDVDDCMQEKLDDLLLA